MNGFIACFHPEINQQYLVIYFAPVNLLRKQILATDPHGQERDVKPELRKVHNHPHTRSPRSLKTQRPWRKPSIPLALIYYILVSSLKNLILSRSYPCMSVAKKGFGFRFSIDQSESNLSKVDNQITENRRHMTNKKRARSQMWRAPSLIFY